MQHFYYLGLNRAFIAPSMSNPELVAELGRHRPHVNPWSYFGSTRFRELDERLGGQVTQRSQVLHDPLPHHTLMVSLGGDFCQPHTFKDYSLGMVCIR